ncbi:hypothetical protein [Xylophilus sp. ASV27]|uniref:hypothetical protein n=1 Tax=Xylophilus sp. ASV27 TaxID=2795129 RepID=UPI0018EB6F22|nr:hypothetical protein [Xylophilus sp. ASV27]
MADRRPHIGALLLLSALAAGGAHAQHKTIADRAAEAEVTYELLMKQRQINDMLVADPILKQLPAVASVLILQDKRTARLVMPNGVVQTFAEGEEIAERMHLRSVSPRMVRVLIEPLPNAKSRAPVALALPFAPTRGGGTSIGVSGFPGPMGPGQVPGMPAAPLAVPPGLIQAPPTLPFAGAAARTAPAGTMAPPPGPSADTQVSP